MNRIAVIILDKSTSDHVVTLSASVELREIDGTTHEAIAQIERTFTVEEVRAHSKFGTRWWVEYMVREIRDMAGPALWGQINAIGIKRENRAFARTLSRVASWIAAVIVLSALTIICCSSASNVGIPPESVAGSSSTDYVNALSVEEFRAWCVEERWGRPEKIGAFFDRAKLSSDPIAIPKAFHIRWIWSDVEEATEMRQKAVEYLRDFDSPAVYDALDNAPSWMDRDELLRIFVEQNQ